MLSGPAYAERIEAISILRKMYIGEMKFNKDNSFMTPSVVVCDIGFEAKKTENIDAKKLVVTSCNFEVS